MTIFLVLNGMGLVFLLYVLANFWKDGQRSGSDGLRHTSDFRRWDGAGVVVITQPISRAPQGELSVIPFQSRSRELSGALAGNAGGREAVEARVAQLSAR